MEKDKQSKFTLPSFEQVENARKPKKPTLFFKPRAREEANAAAGSSISQQAAANETIPLPPTAPITVAAPVSVPVQSTIVTDTATTSTSHSRSETPTQPSTKAPTPASTPASTPVPPKRSIGGTVLVNPNQQQNPILRNIHNVPWEIDNAIRTDYVVGNTTGVLYLSLRYHRLYPTYIYDRMGKLTHMYVLKVLLVLVDIENYHESLRELNRTAVLNGYTLILAWSIEEAGRYLETYKVLENKPSDMIRERVVEDYCAKMTDCLTQTKSVNKTDVLTLLSNFGSFSGIAKASKEQLSMCPGFGEQKVRRLQQAFSQPFIVKDH